MCNVFVCFCVCVGVFDFVVSLSERSPSIKEEPVY